MVAAAPLPTLTPEDSALFLRFINAGASLAKLADSHKDNPHSPTSPTGPTDLTSPNPTRPIGPISPIGPIPPSLPALYHWSTQPHIAPWIAFHQSQLDQADQREMVAHLKVLARSSENPVERRRAATTLLRALGLMAHGGTASGGTTLRGVRAPPSPRPGPRPEDPPRGGGNSSDSRRGTERPDAAARAENLENSGSPIHPSTHSKPSSDSAPTTLDQPPSPFTPYTWKLPKPKRAELSLPTTPDLDAARLAHFAGTTNHAAQNQVPTPPSSPLPHPTFSPKHVLSLVLNSFKGDAGFITAFNHSGIEDRSHESLELFSQSLRTLFPHLPRSYHPLYYNECQHSDHAWSCLCSLAYPNYNADRFRFRCTFKRPTEGPLARCWLLTMEPENGRAHPDTS